MIQRPTPTQLRRLLWAAPVSFGVCYFALWACGPVYNHPLPAPIPQEKSNQITASGGYSSALGLGSNCDSGVVLRPCEGPDFSLAYRRQTQQPIELLGILHGGAMSLAGAGIGLRGYPHHNESARVGLMGGLGWAYAQFGVPVAVRLADPVWLTTEPTIAVNLVGWGRLPVGLAIAAGPASVEVEAAVITSSDGFPPVFNGSLGLGIAF